MAILETGTPPSWLVVSTGLAAYVGEGAPWPREFFRPDASAKGPVNDADSVTGSELKDEEGGLGDATQCKRKTSPG